MDSFSTHSTNIDLKSSLENFFAKISTDNSDFKIIVNLIERIFVAASSDNNESNISLLDVRVRDESLGYPMNTDWHTDDMYEECQHRNFITLVGPSTLFYNDNDIKSKIYADNDKGQFVNYTYQDSLIDYSKVDRAGTNQGVVFYQGTDNAALHRGPIETGLTRIAMIIDKCDVSVIPKLLEVISDNNVEL